MAPTPPYVELHCHSAYSFLDGVSLPQELAQRAGELGHVALGLTDHNSVSGSMELAQAASDCGIRAIHGAEIDLDDGRHITLLVRDERGWRNLCRIITLAHAHTRDGAHRSATAHRSKIGQRRSPAQPAHVSAGAFDRA
jgi:error-prone DNA polymerase